MFEWVDDAKNLVNENVISEEHWGATFLLFCVCVCVFTFGMYGARYDKNKL